MKLRQVRGIILMERLEAPWDEAIVAKLGELSPYCFFSKLAGLNDDFRALVRCEVSILYKAYAALLMSIMSFVAASQAFLHAISPSLVLDEYAIVTLTSMKDISIFMRPIYSLSMASTRIVLAAGLSKKSYLISMRRILRSISCDPYLSTHRIDLSNIKAIFAVVTVGYVLWVVVAAMAFISAKPPLARNPMFYVVMFERYLHVSAISIGGCYLLVLSWFVVLPLLRIVANIFEDAVKSADIDMLRSAMACHDKCRRLIEGIDEIGSYFFGFSVLTGVPLVAIAASILSRLQEEHAGHGFRVTMVFSFLYFLFMIFFIYVASAVYIEARKPLMILADTVIIDGEFLKLSYQFSARFQVRSFGYTLFHVVTITRETILSVFGLITTYVIIAFQLKAR